ncbi:AsmA family protein [Facilibium subflavum]|uniref:AsmA family protein n=1 Tax=Facilibium subflavum TaxID=2219058 RepID=UPI0013C2A8AF|nr:AsmA family protein [Facilibium subflavum]
MLKKTLLVIITALIILCIGITIWLGFFFNPNEYKSLLNKQLNNNPNIHVKIKGNISWQLWPLSLTAQDISIDSAKAFSSHWQQAKLKISLINLFSSQPLPIKKIQLINGQIHHNHMALPIKKLTLQQAHFSKLNRIMLSAVIQNKHMNATVNTMLSQDKNLHKFTIYPTTITGEIGHHPFQITVASFDYQQGDNQITISPIHTKIAGSTITTNLNIPSLNPLKLNIKSSAKTLNIEKLINLHGFKLQLSNIMIDIKAHKKKQISGNVDISAKSGLLTGIDLNALAHAVDNFLQALMQGAHIGNAFASFQQTFAPVIGDGNMKPDPTKSTQLGELNINSTFDQDQLTTKSINWQAKNFTLSGRGLISFSLASAYYPVSINLKGKTPFSIPYQLVYQNRQFKGQINQDKLKEHLQPIIEKALKNTLQNKLHSLFG